MSDIVARLNEGRLGFGIGPAGLCQEAAQEITTLRAKLAEAERERQDSAREWRDAFDGMHQRAMAAESRASAMETRFIALEQRYMAEASRANRLASEVERLRSAFRNADEKDWRWLCERLRGAGHGEFWLSVFAEFRAALGDGK